VQSRQRHARKSGKERGGGETDRILRVKKHRQGPIRENAFRPSGEIAAKALGNCAFRLVLEDQTGDSLRVKVTTLSPQRTANVTCTGDGWLNGDSPCAKLK
jgi:hypothetical protein